jgi:hypothetical protein
MFLIREGDEVEEKWDWNGEAFTNPGHHAATAPRIFCIF